MGLNLARLLTQKKPDDSTPDIEAQYKTKSYHQRGMPFRHLRLEAPNIKKRHMKVPLTSSFFNNISNKDNAYLAWIASSILDINFNKVG